MPTYEFRCRACGSTFEERRSMRDADLPARCPEGHHDVARLLSVFATVSSGAAGAGPLPSGGGGGGGGCCGGACGC